MDQTTDMCNPKHPPLRDPSHAQLSNTFQFLQEHIHLHERLLPLPLNFIGDFVWNSMVGTGACRARELRGELPEVARDAGHSAVMPHGYIALYSSCTTHFSSNYSPGTYIVRDSRPSVTQGV